MNNNLKHGVRLAGVGAVSAVALGFFSAGAANADTFVPLPDGQISRTLSDGTVVTVSRVGESALISPSLGSTPLHRNVWTSGTAVVDVQGDKSSGDIEPGYIVGCQIDMGGASFGAGVGAEGSVPTDGSDPSGGVSGTGDSGLSLGPGQAVKFPILDLEKPDDFGSRDHGRANSFEGNSGSVSWSDVSFGVTGCAGYAQARSYITTTVSTETGGSKVTLWGQPFSIG
ncbi:MAG TPA: MspA family porin [Aldersonia sp.]